MASNVIPFPPAPQRAGDFASLEIRFDESNASFAEAVLPMARIAVWLCNSDGRGVEKFVTGMTSCDFLSTTLEGMRKARRNLGALCEWLDEAEARIVAVQGEPPSAPRTRA